MSGWKNDLMAKLKKKKKKRVHQKKTAQNIKIK